MRKIVALAASAAIAAGIAVPAFAAEMSGSASATVGAKKTVDIACVQKAVDKREDALIAGWTSFNTSMSAAYSARKTALHDAWGMSDATARKTAVKTAWENFKKSAKAARQAWKTARKNAWQTFRSDAKACKGAAAEASVEASGESADND